MLLRIKHYWHSSMEEVEMNLDVIADGAS